METENKKKDNTGEFVVLAIIACISIFMLVSSRDLRLLGRLFPQLIAGLTLLMCLVQGFLLLRKNGQPAAGGKKKKPANNLKNHYSVVVIGFVYLILLPFVGFILTTIALLVAVPRYLGYTNNKVVWTIALLSTGIFYYVFKTLFYVPLPQGLITFI